MINNSGTQNGKWKVNHSYYLLWMCLKPFLNPLSSAAGQMKENTHAFFGNHFFSLYHHEYVRDN